MNSAASYRTLMAAPNAWRIYHAFGRPLVFQVRRHRTFVGFAAVAAATSFAALGQLAWSPSARADLTVTDIVNAVDGSVAAGQADFALASTDFTGGDPADALGYFFAGVNDILLGPSDDIVFDGYAVLNAVSTSGTTWDFGPVDAPKDLATANTDITEVWGGAQALFEHADTLFASDQIFNGLYYLINADEELATIPEVGTIGLIGTLFGF